MEYVLSGPSVLHCSGNFQQALDLGVQIHPLGNAVVAEEGAEGPGAAAGDVTTGTRWEEVKAMQAGAELAAWVDEYLPSPPAATATTAMTTGTTAVTAAASGPAPAAAAASARACALFVPQGGAAAHAQHGLRPLAAEIAGFWVRRPLAPPLPPLRNTLTRSSASRGRRSSRSRRSWNRSLGGAD
jgi:hypothetical protein